MKITKPKLPPKLKPDGFPPKTKWNPNRPASAVDNVPPQSMWPIKRGQAVFAIDPRFQFAPVSGRVTWFNPARKVDHSCIVSVGHPFFNVRSGEASLLIGEEHVFKFTTKGWTDCLLKMASMAQSMAAKLRFDAEDSKKAALELDKIERSLVIQAKGKR